MLNPFNPSPLEKLDADFLADKGIELYIKRINACREAIKLKPDYDLAYNNICSAYNMLHDFDNAIVAGQKAVQINPANQQAKNNLQAAIDAKKSGK